MKDHSVFGLVGLIAIFLAGALNSACASECLLPPQEKAARTLLVPFPAIAEWKTAAGGLLGTSVLYSIDDDRAWQQAATLASLKYARVATLRYPGGELADNYDWERHALERPKEWPGEAATEAERAGRTDYLEFLAYARKLGVEQLFFVVNVDGAFRAPGNLDENLLRYARKAARWVKAVKAAGYRVQYWEIGNEPYLAAGYPLAAHEYARALKIFAREMRAADPDILIGAAGPPGVKQVTFADRLTPAQLDELRGNGGNLKKACPNLTPDQCVEKLERTTAGKAAGQPWWDTLLAQARDDFDFAIIHRYEQAPLEAAGRGEGFPLSAGPHRLRAHLEQAKGRRVPIALTEWNTPNENKRKPLTEIEHLLNIAVQLGSNAAGGVDFAHYWPLRTPGTAFKPLLSVAGEKTAVAELFAMAGEILPGAQVAQSMPAKGLFVLRSAHAGQDGFLAVNAGREAVTLELDAGDHQKTPVTVRRLVGNRDGSVAGPSSCAEDWAGGRVLRLKVPPRSVTLVQL